MDEPKRYEILLEHMALKYKAQFFAIAGIFMGFVGLFFRFIYHNNLMMNIFLIAMLLAIIPTIILNVRSMRVLKRLKNDR